MKPATQRDHFLYESTLGAQIFKIFDQQSLKSLVLIEQNSKKQCTIYELNKSNKLQRYTVQLKLSEFSQAMSIYEWRKLTDLPIVKTHFVEVINKSQNTYTLNIYNESYQSKLSELSNIPFNQIIYILKESIIGFQRLFYRFGPFKIVPDMICINTTGQCKVWINQCYEQNKLHILDISENEFTQNLLTILAQKVPKKIVSTKFFQELEKIDNMIDILDYIQEYIKKKKIIVPSIFEQSSYGEMRKTRKTVGRNQNTISCSNLLKHHKSQQKIKMISQSQLNCQEKFEKLSYGSMNDYRKQNKRFRVSSSNLNPFENIQNNKTLKTSSNTTISYTFKSKLNLNHKYYHFEEKKQKQIKPRKQSQKVMANSYQIFEFDLMQASKTDRLKFGTNSSEKITVNLNFIKQIPSQARITQQNTELVSDQQSQQQQIDTLQIYKKNGWSNNIQGIFNTIPLKQSFRIGQDQNLLNTQYQFTILKPPGLVYKSILPQDLE